MMLAVFLPMLAHFDINMFIISIYTDTHGEKTPTPKDIAEKEVTSSTTSNNEVDEKAKHEHKKDKKLKMVTRDKNLLLACSYFDLNHSGYIETKDAEDILLSLNLNLSRAQVTINILLMGSGTCQLFCIYY